MWLLCRMAGICTTITNANNRLVLLLVFRLLFLAQSFAPSTSRPFFATTKSKRRRSSISNANIPSDPTDSNFGRKDYWNSLYEKESNFSWYAGWDELEPFVTEFVPSLNNPRMLLPGVGNDQMLVDMVQYGYTNLTAMDYAPEGIERCRDMLMQSNNNNEVQLVVADARNLQGVFENDEEYFDAVFEKGTLDAIYLSGGKNKTLAAQNLQLALTELSRCVRKGGIWISVAGVVDKEIYNAMNAMTMTNPPQDDKQSMWTCLVGHGSIHTTDDGYTSNNIDGSLLVWKKNE
mmetsp:Transcript_31058/g.47379  ORF Transcript_31058/g.47379 Transcript_31058/m.47379 type:complete len:290 (+) Transcript_31058:122-991(+)